MSWQVDMASKVPYNQGMKASARKKNFHLPLPSGTYSELKEVAHDLKRPATQVARDVLEFWLKQRRRASLKREIAAYAADNAGTGDDLDLGLETAGIDFLRAAESPETFTRSKKARRRHEK
jgi:hypothetical protein